MFAGLGQDGAGTSPHNPIPLQPEVTSRTGPARLTRSSCSPGTGRHGHGDGTAAEPRQGGEISLVMGRHGHGYSDRAGTQCQGRSWSTAPELRAGLQRWLLPAPLPKRAVSQPWPTPGCTAVPHQSLMASGTGSQTPREGGRGCSDAWWARGPDAHLPFKTPGRGVRGLCGFT